MAASTNPYDWQSHNPRIEVPRPLSDRVAATLGEGGSAVVLGGRGMGKSVYLQQIKAALGDDVRVVVVPAPPPELTVRACLGQLAEVLGVEPASNSRRMVDAYFAKTGSSGRLVLLFDEFDRYAEIGDSRSPHPPGRGFFNDLEATRRDVKGFGVLATGSLGVYVVRDVLGSSFLSRAMHVGLAPFDRSEIETLARPFAERGHPLSEDVEDALYLATGGIPALTTFGLQKLWNRSSPPVERDVTEVFTDFMEEHDEYLYDLLDSVFDPRLSDAPQRVWEKIRNEPGEHWRADLEAACGPQEGPLKLRLVDILRLLQAAGLVRFTSSVVNSDPVTAYPIPSLVELRSPHVPRSQASLREHLARDLEVLLMKLHRSSADFFRPRNGKRLVPEAVFAAYLALGFELMGWQTEREAQSAAGRTDLKLRRNGSGEVAVIEVKIWGRNDCKLAHQQVLSYWTSEVKAGAVVQITDSELADWPETYRRECVEPYGESVESAVTSGSPVRARLAVASRTDDGFDAHVEHFLLRLARR